MFGGQRRRAGPDDLKGEFTPNEQLGVASDTDAQSVCNISVSFREAFFFQLKAPVRFVKRHTELMRSCGKRVLEMHRLALLPRRQVRREE